MLSFLSLFCLFLCDFYLICSALVFHEWWKDIGMKALTNFPSILHDGNCTNIVFVEDLRHQESFDAIRHMFLNVMTEEAYINYLMYIPCIPTKLSLGEGPPSIDYEESDRKVNQSECQLQCIGRGSPHLKSINSFFIIGGPHLTIINL